MSGATEATLAELLREAQNTNVNLARLNSLLSSSGGGSGGGGSSPLAGIVRTGPIAGLALGALSAATNVVAGVFKTIGYILGKVVGGFTDTVKNLYAFSVSAAMGTAKLSDFYAAFKDLPFFMGTVATIFSQVIKYSEDLLEVYQNLTKVGASFGGDLFVMRNAAARAQLSMSEFAGVVSRNSELFASMGGNVQAGINQFVNIQNRLMGPNSPYARQLLALGYSSADAAEMIASYMRGQGTMNKQELMNTEKVTKGVVAYATELDTLSKLTGKQREKIEEELKAVEMEETYQRFLSQLDEGEAKRIRIAVANMLQTGGKDAAEQLKLAVRGINTPITKGQMDLAASTQGLNLAVNDIIVQAIRQGKSEAEIGKLVREQSMRIGKQQFDLAKQLGESTVAALLASGSTIVTAGNQFSSFYRKLLADSKLPEAERKIIEQRLRQEEGNAATLSEAQQNIKNFGNDLLMAASLFIAPLTGVLIKFGQGLTDTISKLVSSKGFKDSVEDVSKWFQETFRLLNQSKTPEQFFTTLIERAIDAFNKISAALTPVWENSIKPRLIKGWEDFTNWMKSTALPEMRKFYDEKLKPMLTNLFTGMMEWLIYNLRKNSMIARFLFDETDREKDERKSVEQSPEYARLLAAAQAEQAQLAPEMQTGIMYDAIFAQAKAEMEARLQRERSRAATPAPRRHSGTLGMTGFGTERSNQLVEVQPNEAVLTSEQLDRFGRSLAMGVEINNNLSSELKTLNKQTADMIKFLKETAEYTRRSSDAIRDLNGNLFAA